MIRPPRETGAAFSEAADGDIRNDPAARVLLSEALGITGGWATVRQVHGSTVHRVTTPSVAGDGDALWTTVVGLPLAVFTADCFGVVLRSEDAAGVAHAGWRGVEAGVVESLRTEMSEAGHPPTRAAVGPGIGACCFEVGPDVAGRFPGETSSTSWETVSVDLKKGIGRQLRGLEVWVSGACTRHEEGWFSHRESGTSQRLAAVGWVP